MLALVFGWYLSGDFPVATTSGQGTCTSATVIAHGRGHALLLKDCNVLLSIRDTLAGGREPRLGRGPAHRAVGGHHGWRDPGPGDGESASSPGTSPGPFRRGIAGLSGLEVLQLPINNLKGALPSEVGDLSRLRDLGLHGNALTGEIPPIPLATSRGSRALTSARTACPAPSRRSWAASAVSRGCRWRTTN